jgi:pSer/pThr/pTyr-binding forkhead associated (FHA) protein
LPVAVVPVAERVGWVCDACDAWNLEGSARCSFCGERLGLEVVASPSVVTAAAVAEPASGDEDETTDSAVTPPSNDDAAPTLATPGFRANQPIPASEPDSGPETMPATPRVCAACGTPTIPNHRFCGNCGAPLVETPPAAAAVTNNPAASGAMRSRAVAVRAEIVLVQADGTDGARFEVGTTPQVAGRTEGTILFPDDRLLSGRHASLVVEGGALLVEDLGSTNGTFMRLAATHPLVGGDAILLGEQLLLFRHPVPVSAAEPDSAGTIPYVSSASPAAFHLVQIMAGGRAGAVFTPVAPRVTIGREASDICFPTDRFLSSRHARIEPTESGFQLVDLQSRNGTYIRIRGRAAIRSGETVFLGQQLFRFVVQGA